MTHAAPDPVTCPDCKHLVHRPLLAPIRHPHETCRALVPGVLMDLERCECDHPVHRVLVATPRHRAIA